MLARDQFQPMCKSWHYKDWDEYDYGRIKNLQFREIEEKRRKEGQLAADRKCLQCPHFLKHVSDFSLGSKMVLTVTVCHGA